MDGNQPVDRHAAERAGPAGSASLRMIFGLLVLLVAAKFLVGPIVETVQYSVTRGQERAKAEVARTQLGRLADTSAAFRLVAQAVGPSVVHIDTYRQTAVSNRAGNEAEEDEWEQIYGDRPQQLLSTGQGSGVIVDESGYVLTNYHVIRQASAIKVKLSDGRTIRECQVVGVDPPTDLALLKIKADGLTAANWGDSDSLEVGDWVLAVGNPFGLDRSVTAGIVSAKQRRQVVDNMPYQDFLQTDAAVNPGNSGGPLVNLKGEVVGINAAIVGHGYQGISFAIPSGIARDIYQRLKATGTVARGWLGVSLDEVTKELADERGLTAAEGVLVRLVFPDSPAMQAGIVADDVIVEWNRHRVSDPTGLSLAVARTEIGAKVPVIVQRGAKQVRLEVVVGERPERLLN
jgi:serine protease Do